MTSREMDRVLDEAFRAVFGWQPETPGARLVDMPLTRRPANGTRNAAILKLRGRGMTYAQIAEAMDLNRSIVAGVVNRAKRA